MRIDMRATLAALGLLLIAGEARAQAETTHMDCTAAAQVALNAQDPRITSIAYSVLARCPDGSSSLASAWSNPPADPEILSKLAHRSAELADVRILNAVLATLQNTGASAAARRAALDVVLAQYSPSVVASRSTWEDPEHASLGYRSDVYQVQGEQPVTAADRDRIVAAFRSMSASDPDTDLRRIATRIVKDLGSG